MKIFAIRAMPVQHCLVVTWLVLCETAAISVHIMWIQLCTSLQCQFIQSHSCRMHVCLAVTCHKHFWHKDRNLLRAAAVTCWWNGYRNESAQNVDPRGKKKKKKISRLSFGDSNPGSFDHESGALTTELCPLPDDVTV